MINTHKREGDRGREASESKRQMGHTHTHTKIGMVKLERKLRKEIIECLE